jgi:hypothetical protein
MHCYDGSRCPWQMYRGWYSNINSRCSSNIIYAPSRKTLHVYSIDHMEFADYIGALLTGAGVLLLTYFAAVGMSQHCLYDPICVISFEWLAVACVFLIYYWYRSSEVYIQEEPSLSPKKPSGNAMYNDHQLMMEGLLN